MKSLTRRQVLAASGTGAIASVAGCSGNPFRDPNPGTPTTEDGDTTVGPCGAPEIGGALREDTTLVRNCEYLVTRTLFVTGDKLTIQPGVTLRFRRNAGLAVTAGGQVDAVGTLDDPITFTGEEEGPGSWIGVLFRGPGTEAESRLERVTIHNGGGSAWSQTSRAANLTLHSQRGDLLTPDVVVSLTACAVRGSPDIGIAFLDDGIDLTMDRCVIDGNGIPVRLPATAIHLLDPASNYRGNHTDYARVTTTQLHQDIEYVWRPLQVPYRFEGQATVTSGVVTVDPGTVLTFESEGALATSRDGALDVSGSPDRPVRFSGVEKGPGQWRGLRFDSTDDRNRLVHAIVEYAGSVRWSATEVPASVTVVRDRPDTTHRDLLIEDTIVRNGGGYGIQFVNEVVVETARNTVIGHELAAAHVPATAAHQFDPSSTHRPNGADVVEVTAGDLHRRGEYHWRNLDVPYLIKETVTVSNARLRVAPGTRFVFRDGTGLIVHREGRLSAVGVGDDPVVFTAETPQPGAWRGIFVNGAAGSDNRIEHAVVEYGGSERWPATRVPACITVRWDPGRSGNNIFLASTIVRRSAGYGMHLVDDVTFGVDGCRITENASGPIHLPAATVHQLEPSTSFLGNARDVIDVMEDTLSAGGEATWSALNVPYLINGTVTISRTLLVIDVGARLQFLRDTGLSVVRNGSLITNGTSDANVVLEGAQGEAWNGIYIRDAVTTVLHTTLRHSGNRAMPLASEPASVTIVGNNPVFSANGITIEEYNGIAFYLSPSARTSVNPVQLRGGGGISNLINGENPFIHSPHAPVTPSEPNYHA